MKWNKFVLLFLLLPFVLLADPPISFEHKRIDPWTDADPFLRLDAPPVQNDSLPDEIYFEGCDSENRTVIDDLLILMEILGFELW
ncbi:MAG: hypothetical protein DRQ04_05780 [Candidatus Hydrothermota bacterium]|nr:MAG: hypothetical protein DRQ04_05780 [Candidatus Hydrothermae bacterium]